MGGGKGGEFGNTRGGTLDAISNWLAVASLIPGLDTFTDIASIPVDLLRGDYVSAGLDLIGVIPFIGEVGDAAKLARVADNIIDASKAANKASDAAKTTKKASKIITNPVLKRSRVGSASKLDAHHAFPNLIDNYAGKAKTFSIKGADGKVRELYQIKGSLNGKDGIYEWIVDNEKGVTHRRFILNGEITGKPNSR